MSETDRQLSSTGVIMTDIYDRYTISGIYTYCLVPILRRNTPTEQASTLCMYLV